ncbi:MAG: ASCH domain-containing protein [Aquabacterium sp.]|nr:ASCH domain-containing protein [Aquabacterium sp.]
MAKLHLNLKAEYFDQIKAGVKPHEFRLQTPYWCLRLLGKSFDGIVLKKGYPKAGDPDRTIERPWRGIEQQKITHPHFGANPVAVFAIRVN